VRERESEKKTEAGGGTIGWVGALPPNTGDNVT
jgi:hypothetical protein